VIDTESKCFNPSIATPNAQATFERTCDNATVELKKAKVRKRSFFFEDHNCRFWSPNANGNDF